MKNWHIKSQVLILQIIGSVLVALLVTTYLLLVYTWLIAQQQQESRKILFSQLEMLTSSTLNLYTKSIEQVNYQSQQSIRAVQDVFTNVLTYDIQSKENSGICQYFKKETNQFCYLIPNETSGTNINIYQDTTNVLESLKFQIAVEKLYFVSSQTDQYFTIYPTFVLKNYYPQSRPWYKNHQLKKNESLFVTTDPYISMFSGIMYTETATLLDTNQFQKGVIGHDYNTSSYSVFNIQIKGIKISLIDRVGRLLISSYYNNFSTDFKFIQNETITGLNDTDFEQILNYTDDKPYTSQCELDLKETLCIQTSDDIPNQLIRTSKINSRILILQIDEQLYLQQLEDLLNTFSENFKSQAFLFLYFALAMVFLMLFSNFLTQCFISYPLQRLQQLVRQKSRLQMKNQLDFYKGCNSQNINWIEQLELTVIQMFKLQNLRKKNNQILLDIQKIQYPRRNYKFPNLEKLRNFIEDTKDHRSLIQFANFNHSLNLKKLN